MKRSLMTQVLGILALLASLWGCGKALQPGMTGLTFEGTRSATSASHSALGSSHAVTGSPVIAVKDRSGVTVGQLTLTTALVSLREIKIKLPDEEESEDNIKFRGPYIVNLVDNSVTPQPTPIRLSAGAYRSLQVKVHRVEEGDDADALVTLDSPLRRRSIYLEGTYTGLTSAGSVTAMPFRFASEISEEFTVRAGASDLVISDSDPNPVIVAFKLAEWFDFSNVEANDQSVDFDDVIPVSGAIELSEDGSGVNKKIAEVIRKALKYSGRYGKDSDESGSLSDDEAGHE